jgi:hypothetical protein
MPRNNNTYMKRQRDLQKKQKMEDKNARRLKRKESSKSPEDSGDGERPDASPLDDKESAPQ